MTSTRGILKIVLLATVLCAVCLHAEIKQFFVLQTTDTHGEFLPGYYGGGYVKMASLIRQIRQRTRPERTLLIDCGDSVQGSIATAVTHGNAGLIPLKSLNVDVWVPGNHEFDFGLDQFASFAQQMSDVILCGNLAFPEKDLHFPAWKIIEKDGIRIAVIGLAPSFMASWLVPSQVHHLTIKSGIQLLEDILPEIHKAKPDAIILASHQGWFFGGDKRGVNEIDDIAKLYPEIDLILGAHTHREFPGQVIGKRSWYVQAAHHATHVAFVTVTVDTDKHAVTDIKSVLLPVTEDLPNDELLAEQLGEVLFAEDQEKKRIIPTDFPQNISGNGTSGINCQTSELIAMAIAEYAQADVVFHGRLSKKALHKGTMTGLDLFALIPYENALVTAQLTPAQIEAICAEQLKWKQHYSYCPIYGAKMTCINGKCTLNGLGADGIRKCKPDERLTVAFNSHAAAGSGRFAVLRSILEQPESKTTILPLNTREAVEQFLVKHPQIQPTPVNWVETH